MLDTKKKSLLHIFLIAAFIAAIFFPSLYMEWKYIEDNAYFISNPLFSNYPIENRLAWAWAERPESNYIPLTWSLTIILQKLSSGPFSIHLTSLLIHIANSILAYLLCRKLRLSGILSAVAVLIFALHPLRVESVVWASSIKGLLAANFLLLTFYLWYDNKVKFAPLAFLLSILSKQTLIAAPIICLLDSKGKKLPKLSLGIMVGISVIGAALAIWSNQGNPSPFLSEGITLRPLHATAALGHYTFTNVFPINLIVDYPKNISALNLCFGLCILLATGWALWKTYQGSHKIYHIAIIAFVALLVPVLGIIPTPLEFAADRLSYLPSLFLIIAIISLCSEYMKHSPAVLAFRVLPLSYITHQQINLWSDLEKQCKHALAAYPNHYTSLMSLAHLEAREKNFEQAADYAILVTEEHPIRYEGWETLVQIYLSTGKTEQATATSQRAHETAPSLSPNIHLLEAEIAQFQNDLETSIQFLDLAKDKGIDPFTIHYKKALSYLRFSQKEKAQSEAQHCIDLQPESLLIKELQQRIKAANQ